MTKSQIISRMACLLIIVATLPIWLNADEQTKRVDKLFSHWDSTVSPGAALAIIKDGEIIYKRGYGMANLEHNIPITPTSVFRIGSTSKQFAAACIALLVLQNRISLNDDIRRYIPEMPQYQKPITIGNIVYHTSGLRDYTSLLSLAGYVSHLDHPTIEETIRILSRQKSLNFPPGEMYSYSNSGYFLMSVIVERVTGKSLNEFAQEHIFKPLGMHNTHFHGDLTRIVKNRAAGYSPTDGGYRINMSTFAHVGDGGIFTTVEDMYLWDQAFYNNKLGKDFVELMQTPGKLNNGEKLDYAFGLRWGSHRGLTTIGHGGSWVGFRAGYIRFPEQRFSVVIFANLSAINPSALCQQIADIYLSDEFEEKPAEDPSVEQPAAISPVILSREKMEEKVGNYQEEESGNWIVISLENDKLKMNIGRQEFYLTPVSETQFQALDAPYEVSLEFSPAAKAKPLKAVATIRGTKSTLVRAPELSPLTPSQLKEYAGEYYSAELLTTYRVMVEEDRLTVRHRYDPQELKAMAPDKFVAGSMNIEFFKDKRGKVAGFSLSAGRVRNIQFIRK